MRSEHHQDERRQDSKDGKVILPDVAENQFGNFILALAVRGDDEVVVVSVVARGARVLVDIVFAHPVHFLDDLLSLLAAHTLFAHDALDAVIHRRLDEDAQAVGLAFQNVESGTAGNDARLILDDALQDFLFGQLEVY